MVMRGNGYYFLNKMQTSDFFYKKGLLLLLPKCNRLILLAKCFTPFLEH